MDYDVIAPSYNELHREEQLNKVRIIIKELKITNEKVLDVGCGTALYSYFFNDYTGIDNSKKMLEQSNARVIYGKAENLPFHDSSFDAVICVTAIHNFKEINKAITEIRRVSKNKIAITVFKRAKNFLYIKTLINKNFKNIKEIEEEKDIIFIINQTY